ncbi:MAG: M28 family metallopeptidase [Gammaproteobacteria bacterium]
MNRHASALGFVLLSIAIAACSRSPEPAAPSAPAPVDPVAAAAAAISASALERNIRELSSDAFGGRKPDTPGEQLTIELLEREFRGLGLQPASGGSFVQEVPLVELEAGPEVRLGFSAGGSARPTDLPYRERQVIYSRRMDTAISVKDAGVVFVGYGVNAPERGWNDYAGVDVRGKVVLMLINDPGFHANDPALFNGRAMTYYGRWDYKFDEAARQGAIGALIIHDNEGATYPWRTVQNSWTGPTFHLPREDRGAALSAFQGWVANEAAREMLAAAGAGLDDLMREAGTSGFRARTLPLRLSAGFANRVHEIRSRNVAAVLPGRERPDEAFIYMAHWDHIGSRSDTPPGEDGIFNGALDNASGTAGLIELARAFRALPEAPRRSVLFLAVTAEEQGLLGSAWYAANPLIPLAHTVGGLNMDGLNNFGPTRDVTVVGLGNSTLDAYLERALTPGRRLEPHPYPERGSFFRSDHFELAKAGVPMLFAGRGVDHVEHGAEWGRAQDARYVAERYHGPEDEWTDDWRLDGAVEDLQLFFRTGLAVADSADWPEWAADSEFRALREAQRGAATPGG